MYQKVMIPPESMRHNIQITTPPTAERALLLGLVSLLLLGVLAPPARGVEETDDRLHFSFTPYFWAPGIDGDVKVKGNQVDVDVDFSDLFDVLECNAAFHVEAKKGRWGLFGDMNYISLQIDKALKPKPPFARADFARADMDMWIIEFGGLFRLGQWQIGERERAMTLETLFGGRYWDIEQEVTVAAVTRKADTSWVDPIIGLRLIMEINNWLSVHLRGDVGGFAIYDDASEFTWNIYAGPVIHFTPNIRLIAGYRILDLDREDGSDKELDITFSGPQLGLQIYF